MGSAEVLAAIQGAKGGAVAEGAVGAGTGTIAFGWKGGIGTSSRVVGGFTVGVLVQSNFGGELRIGGRVLGSHRDGGVDGSCMIVVATDAPVDARNLRRMAERAIWGMARTGSAGSNGSGDYAIAFSTERSEGKRVKNDAMSPLFLATIEAAERSVSTTLRHKLG